MIDRELLDVVENFRSLSDEDARKLILKYEDWIDSSLRSRHITQEMAWDLYFGLLHECDERRFMEDRRRILGKIDTSKYNPLLSGNPDIMMIARLRIAKNGTALN